MKRHRHFPSAPPESVADVAPSPTMSAKRQKIDRESTAAFAASQPLFDTLRNARDRLPDQGMYLTVAANVVQQLHVGLKIEDGNNDVERHAKYMDAVVDAWRLATDAYCDIFSQLTSITAEKPEEGRSAATSHVEFEKMLGTAQQARKLAKSYTLAREKPGMPVAASAGKKEGVESGNSSSSSSDSDAEDVESSQFPPSQPTPTPAAKKRFPNTKFDKPGGRHLWEKGELKVPVSALTNEERKEWAAVQKNHDRANQKKKVAGIIKDSQTNGINKSANNKQGAAKPQQNGARSTPQADAAAKAAGKDEKALKAEIALRMKAKDEAKLAKKAAKKRKRESTDSFLIDNDAAMQTEQAQIVEKPKKKKRRKSEINNGEPDSAPQEPLQSGPIKRKGSVDMGNAEAVKPSKKRKKSKNIP